MEASCSLLEGGEVLSRTGKGESEKVVVRFEDKELVFPSNRPSLFGSVTDRPATH